MKLKDKLAGVEEELSSARDELAPLEEQADSAKESFANSEGHSTDSQEYKDAEAAIRAVSEKRQQIKDLEAAQVGILKMVGQDEPGLRPKLDAAEQVASQIEGSWDASPILASDALTQLRDSGVLTSERQHVGNITLGRIQSREALAAEIGDADVAGLIQPDRRGLIPPLFRPLTLLDLLPSGTTDSNLIEYVQATTLPSAAAETAPGAAKPEQALGFTDASAAVRTIAGWIKVRKQTLADAAGLRAFIDQTLRYDVLRRLEGQVLAGDGIGQNIRGILNTTGILDAPGALGESEADLLHHGIVALQLANHIPGAIVLNPLDNESIRLSRDDSGAGAGTGGYLFGPPSQVGAPTIWGLPTVVTPVMPQGRAIVLDPLSVLILIREGVNILLSDSDQDDFTKNRVTVLAECRAGLAVPRPDGIADVDLTPA